MSMESYESVMAEVDREVAQAVQKDAGLTPDEALHRVFKDQPELYRRYKQASAATSSTREAATSRPSPPPRGAEAEALRRAEALVAKSADLSPTDALARVFKKDSALYQRYWTSGHI
jgi:hypothetical protein